MTFLSGNRIIHFLDMCIGSCLENIEVHRAYQNIIECSGSEDTLYECDRDRNTGCTDVAGVYCGKHW